MNIVVLTSSSFPIGFASTNRLLSYSKPIVESGNKMKVICLIPTEIESETIQNKDIKGEYKGIFFEYSSGTTLWPKSGEKKLKKLYLILKGNLNGISLLVKENKSNPIDAVLLYSNSFFSIILFYFVSKIIGVNFIQEKNEYPHVLKNKSFIGKIYSFLYVNIAYKLCDGMMIETNALIQYYNTKIRKRTKVCKVPMTVDTERFNCENNSKNQKYIAYCGNMSEGEGIDVLIDAFKIISDKFNDVKLYLIGAPSQVSLFEDYKKSVKDYNLEDRIIFIGKIKSDEVPHYLFNASILALARKKSIHAEGSLPSKLGEYLSTSNPVIITKNGEITDYFQDGVNAYLAEPDNIQSFAEKLDYVLSHPLEAKEVGLKGRKIADENFNARIHANSIINFIRELNNKR
jgi:glycosyltransferase involved in cell wall biosynthesis